MNANRPTNDTELSSAGLQRRHAILAVAQSALGQRVRERRSRRAIAAALALAFLTVCVAPFARRTLSRHTSSPIVVVEPVHPAHPTNTSLANALPTDLGYPFELIDDAQLLDELNALGHPLGVMRVGADDVRLVASDGKCVPARTLARHEL